MPARSPGLQLPIEPDRFPSWPAARADPALRAEFAGLARTCDRAGLEAWAGRLAEVLNREAA